MSEFSENDQTTSAPSYVCFSGSTQLAAGSIREVALAAWQFVQMQQTASTLTFDRRTGKVVDLNLSGTRSDIAARYEPRPEPNTKRGRPKLGVVAREITLLPRHWDWLAQQPGGASVTIRKLIEAARKDSSTRHENREHVTAAYTFMSAIAGDFPSFEEASRALFSGDFAKFETTVDHWPNDIRYELMRFLKDVLPKP